MGGGSKKLVYAFEKEDEGKLECWRLEGVWVVMMTGEFSDNVPLKVDATASFLIASNAISSESGT